MSSLISFLKVMFVLLCMFWLIPSILDVMLGGSLQPMIDEATDGSLLKLMLYFTIPALVIATVLERNNQFTKKD